MDAVRCRSHPFGDMDKSKAISAVGAALLLHGLATSAGAQDFSDYSGAELYQRFCASCHGTTAQGDGPVASVLNVAVPDLTRLAVRHRGIFPVEQVRRIVDGRDIPAAHGARRMPIWGYEFAAASISDPEAGAEQASKLIDRLMEFLRSIQIRRTDASSGTSAKPSP